VIIACVIGGSVYRLTGNTSRQRSPRTTINDPLF